MNDGQGTHCTKMDAYNLAQNTPNAPKLSAKFVCSRLKVLDFNEKRLHWTVSLDNHLKGLTAGQQASKQLPQFLTVTDVKHVGKQTR